MLGKGPEDPASSYPEYNHLRKVALQSSAVSQCMTKSKSGQHFKLVDGEISIYVQALATMFQVEYHKDAEKILHHHNLPVDYPEFVRAKETAKNASDVSNCRQKLLSTVSLD